jgi:hypothetical protein
VVVRVALDGEVVAADVLDELERPGADRRLGVEGSGIDVLAFEDCGPG